MGTSYVGAAATGMRLSPLSLVGPAPRLTPGSRGRERSSSRISRWQGEAVFEDFKLERIDVGEAELRVRHGGSGPPVLLLHGHPRTHVTWHKVAPLLAGRVTVVCPARRASGESSKPPAGPDHSGYSKRAMAGDCLALMRALGHPQFCVAGHDRGTYVAQRLAMDHPGAVRRLCLMDGIPIGEALARCDATF